MPRTNSLAFRLIAIAAGWSLLGLAVGGLILSSIFRGSVERSFDTRLVSDLESVIAVTDLDCAGAIRTRPLIAERYSNPFSGWYWHVSTVDAPLGAKPKQAVRSRSLWDQTLALPAPPAPGTVRSGTTTGPKNQRLRLAEQVVSLPASDDEPVAGKTCAGNVNIRFVVAGDLTEVDADVAGFNSTLAWSIMVLGAGLIGAMVVQVRLGLAPLGRVSKSLAAIREGRADKLEGEFPSEIQPLADELNALVAHNAEVVARARTHVGNLAHFLKTPLSVLANEVQGVPGQLAETVARQVQVMRRQVDHYLARARTVGSAAVIGARTEVAPVTADLTRALTKIYASRGIRIERQAVEGLSFRGDRSDLEEMIGNLMDNACKWAEGEVTVSASAGRPGRLLIAVSDDGPGLDEAQQQRVLERGERLDETKPGSGLGLGIVKEIASLYGGKFELKRSPAGGLTVELDLPAAERAT
jgi:signal transduction histidine kinase